MTLRPTPLPWRTAHASAGEREQDDGAAAVRFRSCGCEKIEWVKGYALVDRPIIIQRPKR